MAWIFSLFPKFLRDLPADGTLLPSPSAAWSVVHDVDPACVALMPDAGNQQYEGMEAWPRTMPLLGPHAAALGGEGRGGPSRPREVAWLRAVETDIREENTDA